MLVQTALDIFQCINNSSEFERSLGSVKCVLRCLMQAQFKIVWKLRIRPNTTDVN